MTDNIENFPITLSQRQQNKRGNRTVFCGDCSRYLKHHEGRGLSVAGRIEVEVEIEVMSDTRCGPVAV